jgi:adenosylhomocysteine nucleosidase
MTLDGFEQGMTRVAIIAAMPAELKPLVRGWVHEHRGGVDIWRWKFDGGEWVAGCAGAGVEAATRAFAEVERDGTVSSVISVGWAGALSEELEAGSTYWVSGVVDARTGERYRTESPRSQNRDPLTSSGQALGHPDVLLATSPKVADEAEKRRLATAYGAELVDMEGAAVARLAAMRGVPFICLKGVSDALQDQLPDFNRFISERGQFRLVRFILFILIRPWYWPALMRMGENSRKAALGIRERLLENLQRIHEQGALKNRNGDPDFEH